MQTDMDSRNFIFMFYGFAAAWLIVLVYVLILVRRSRSIRSQLERYEAAMESPPSRPAGVQDSRTI